ncbi:hypothetical protein [Altererythrobacter lauratis]|uniref:Regulatory protein RecX n=1 Tax=Alteraurantiacibacter lauratis TaxID=2054627 RepID=A0ABV7EDX1_9SPHN
MKKPVASYDRIDDLKRLMVNARRLGDEAIYNAAFKRRCQLEGINQDDPLHRDFFEVLAAYEELLEEKHGRKQRASYTRRKVKETGVEQCLIDWALDPKETDGFQTLRDRGMLDLTGEHVVTKYPDRFDDHVVAAAKARLERYR